MACSQKPGCMLMILQNVSFMWLQFVKIDTRIRAEQTTENTARRLILAHELQRAICVLHPIPPSTLNMTLRMFITSLLYLTAYFLFSEPPSTETEVRMQ